MLLINVSIRLIVAGKLSKIKVRKQATDHCICYDPIFIEKRTMRAYII